MMELLIAAEQGGFNPLKPEFGLAFWVTLALLLVLYVLAKKVYPRLEQGLADREARIKEDLEKAEETRADAEKILEEYKNRVAQAREEANRIIDEARQAADSVRQDLTKRAEGEARLILDKARNELAGERDRVLSDLQTQLATWSTEIAGRIVEKELTPESHRDLVETFIRDVERPRS